MMFDVSHKTEFSYAFPVVQSQHLVHMAPRRSERQTVRNHSMLVEPAPAGRHEFEDAFGNPLAILDIEVPHKEFVLHARSTIETLPLDDVDLAAGTAWDRLDRDTTRPIARDLSVVQYRCATRLTSASIGIADYADQSFSPGRPVLEAAVDLSRRIYRDFTFDPTATDISTPVTEVFRQRRGVCQDFAHLALACFRAKRIPARYVSGYILTRPPPGQPKLQGADASHAWVAVWSPEFGWLDLDPTNGLIVADEHITIACGRDYDDVSPIRGVLLGGGEHTVTVSVDVVPTA